MKKNIWNKNIFRFYFFLFILLGNASCSYHSAPARIIAITISPVTVGAPIKDSLFGASIIVSQNTQFIAICTYSTGIIKDCTNDSKVTFVSSDPSIAYFSTSTPGLLIPITIGEITVFAIGDGVTSNIIPTTSTPSSTTELTVAGGYYLSGGNTFPMLVVGSTDDWTYKISSTTLQPPNHATDPQSQIYSVSCDGTLCVGVGSYSTNTGSVGMIVVSTDGGNTWTYKVYDGVFQPPNSDSNSGVSFNAVSCSGTMCAAFGVYQPIGGSEYIPMGAISTDSGNTWTYTIDDSSPTPPDFDQNERLDYISCSGSTCIAGGSYRNADSTHIPYLIASTNSGSTWTDIIDANNLPPNTSTGGEVYTVNCSGSVCTAGGYSDDSSGNTLGFLIVSTDGGNNWTYKVDITQNQPPNISISTPYSEINSVSCSGTLCAAAGDYQDTSDNYFGFILVSTDGGNTWSYKVDNTQFPPPNADSNPDAYFDGISCSGTVCASYGYYQAASANATMLIVSTDSGNTWSYKVTNSLLLPPNLGSGEYPNFDSIDCKGLLCSTGGYYYNNTGSFPLLLTSVDGGVTWTYQIYDTAFLPPNADADPNAEIRSVTSP